MSKAVKCVLGKDAGEEFIKRCVYTAAGEGPGGGAVN